MLNESGIELIPFKPGKIKITTEHVHNTKVVQCGTNKRQKHFKVLVQNIVPLTDQIIPECLVTLHDIFIQGQRIVQFIKFQMLHSGTLGRGNTLDSTRYSGIIRIHGN